MPEKLQIFHKKFTGQGVNKRTEVGVYKLLNSIKKGITAFQVKNGISIGS